jgi:DNA-binding IclR family transcriptional regulator
MRALAEKLRINVGLAVADRSEMVYIESIRYNRRPSLRNVVSGQRVPIELTSLGRAWLAVAPDAQRKALFKTLKARRADWPALRREIDAAMDSVRTHGWCVASWQPEIVALAVPLRVHDAWGHVLNVSVSTTEPVADVAAHLSTPLVALSRQIVHGLEGLEPATGRPLR